MAELPELPKGWAVVAVTGAVTGIAATPYVSSLWALLTIYGAVISLAVLVVLAAGFRADESWGQEKYLAVLGKHGIRAAFYAPAIGIRDDPVLSEALDRLAARGYVFFDQNGQMLGGVALAHLTPEEKARARRKAFRVVEGQTSTADAQRN